METEPLKNKQVVADGKDRFRFLDQSRVLHYLETNQGSSSPKRVVASVRSQGWASAKQFSILLGAYFRLSQPRKDEPSTTRS